MDENETKESLGMFRTELMSIRMMMMMMLMMRQLKVLCNYELSEVPGSKAEKVLLSPGCERYIRNSHFVLVAKHYQDDEIQR
jgi:hypothetical protein